MNRKEKERRKQLIDEMNKRRQILPGRPQPQRGLKAKMQQNAPIPTISFKPYPKKAKVKVGTGTAASPWGNSYYYDSTPTYTATFSTSSTTKTNTGDE